MWKANGKKKRKILITWLLKIPDNSRKFHALARVFNFNGNIMCRRATECEIEALRMCCVEGESKSEIVCRIVKKSSHGGGYLGRVTD